MKYKIIYDKYFQFFFFKLCNYVPNVNIFRSRNKGKLGNPNKIGTCTTEKITNKIQLVVNFVIHFDKGKSKSDMMQLYILVFRGCSYRDNSFRTIIISQCLKNGKVTLVLM